MFEQAIYHKPETEYSYAKSENVIALRLRTAREDRPAIKVIYGGKYDFATQRKSADMRIAFSDRLYNYYTVDLVLDDVRLVYVFEINDGGSIYYFSEDGLTDSYDFTFNFYNAFQFAYINEADIHKSVEWLSSACFYQIFVDRFHRGDFEKDASYINLKWGEKPNPKSFAGGDLKGVTHKLEYLQQLGINALYLTPIFKSISNHKYDIEDYYEIDPMFGNEADFADLMRSAHARGIRVVMDAVFNHVSENCVQFQDVLAKGRQSEYFDWFVIDGDKVDADAVNYKCFASCSYMPKWNTSNEKVQKYLIDIALYWIDKYDIDGWRLDVSDEVSHDFWRKFRTAVKAKKSECAIIGENWHDANSYLRGDQYDSIMNYAFTKACLDYFAFNAFGASDLADKLNAILMRNTDTVNGMMLNLLDSHDTHRFITQAGGDEKKLESALAVMYMFSGAPCIYYGTEIAMHGGYDPDCRRTMDWEKAAAKGELWQTVSKLTQLKRGVKALQTPQISIRAEKELLIIERGSTDGGGVRLTLNCGNTHMKLNKDRVVCTNAHGDVKLNEFVIERV